MAEKQPVAPLTKKLRVIRTLVQSSFVTLISSGTLKADLAVNPELAGRISGQSHRIKTRYDSFRVLVQTRADFINSEGATALAESILTCLANLRSLLKDIGFEEAATPYQGECRSFLDEFHLKADEAMKSDDSPIRVAEQLRSKLQARQIPHRVVFYFCVMAAAEYAEGIRLARTDGFARIVRELTFPPEYQQAGLAILNYFSVVLNDKYPDIPVAVSIQQEPDKVTLLIKLPDGSQETISKTLSDYGLVIVGKMTPEDLVGDGLKAIALKQKLELAQLEVKQTREILRLQEQYSASRIESLESQVQNLYSLLGKEFASREKLQTGLMDLASQLVGGAVGPGTINLLQSLSAAIGEKNAERTKIVLEDIQQSEPTLFSRLQEFFVQSASSGVIGNYVYDWLKTLWPILPK
ncbi:hypothetical protein RJO15_12005 [Herbaspirillum huttiense F1]|uniref:hypothetical protein n=1 Tax=Herbaspirillum huttiense TaxID=863372 RepID=UPI0028865C7C|nr:hypothetical protein [Herbaspirillum huttiense]MDT0356499.1 hypothetical protein [Herbaspirillum huttiense F1]